MDQCQPSNERIGQGKWLQIGSFTCVKSAYKAASRNIEIWKQRVTLTSALWFYPFLAPRRPSLAILSFSIQILSSHCSRWAVQRVCQQSHSLSLAKSLIPGYLCYPYHSFDVARTPIGQWTKMTCREESFVTMFQFSTDCWTLFFTSEYMVHRLEFFQERMIWVCERDAFSTSNFIRILKNCSLFTRKKLCCRNCQGFCRNKSFRWKIRSYFRMK